VTGAAREELRELCDYVVDRILLPSGPASVRRQAALCFAIQQVDGWPDYGWPRQQALVDELTTGGPLLPE
jgi:hypothetical protein